MTLPVSRSTGVIAHRIVSAFGAVLILMVLAIIFSFGALSHLFVLLNAPPDYTWQHQVIQHTDLLPYWHVQQHRHTMYHTTAKETLRVLGLVFTVLVSVLLYILFLSYKTIAQYAEERLVVEDGLEEQVLSRTQALLAETATRHRFLAAVLLSVTEGKFQLCATVSEMEWCVTVPFWEMPLTVENLSEGRKKIRQTAEPLGFSETRQDEIITAAGEAMMNAVCHGKESTMQVCVTDTQLQVRITDTGTGISLEDLPFATLRHGWSSKNSLGMGFYLILAEVDQMSLFTCPQGTTLILYFDKVRDPTRRFLIFDRETDGLIGPPMSERTQYRDAL